MNGRVNMNGWLWLQGVDQNWKKGEGNGITVSNGREKEGPLVGSPFFPNPGAAGGTREGLFFKLLFAIFWDNKTSRYYWNIIFDGPISSKRSAKKWFVRIGKICEQMDGTDRKVVNWREDGAFILGPNHWASQCMNFWWPRKRRTVILLWPIFSCEKIILVDKADASTEYGQFLLNLWNFRFRKEMIFALQQNFPRKAAERFQRLKII